MRASACYDRALNDGAGGAQTDIIVIAASSVPNSAAGKMTSCWISRESELLRTLSASHKHTGSRPGGGASLDGIMLD